MNCWQPRNWNHCLNKQRFQHLSKVSLTAQQANSALIALCLMCVSVPLILPEGNPLPRNLSRISLLRSGRDSLSVSRPSSWEKDGESERKTKQGTEVKGSFLPSHPS